MLSLQNIPSPEQIRKATQAVLERPEFAEPPAWNQMLLKIMQGIRDWLDSIGSWSEANPALARAVFICAAIILFACLAHLLYLALADTLPFRRRPPASDGKNARWKILEGEASDWREALALARAKLADGDLRRAVWIAHRVLLGLLDEQGAVRFAGWKTNSQYLRECAATHPWHRIFSELTELYEQTVYASRPIAAERVAASVAQIDRLCAESGTTT
jgi:hypothetical protein